MATQVAETRTSRLVVLVSPTEKREIADNARAVEMSVSDFVRTAAQRYAEPTETEALLLKDLLADLERANERTQVAFEEMEVQREHFRQFDEQAYKEKVRAELEARSDIDWDRIVDFLGFATEARQ